ncbi:MAG TPA: DUF4142 domain-containing protein [Verrucomicrobiae bacterium]|nr:DUF4142 domain-containing protein [Verrucomicrobiae bacterium]
MKRFLLIASAFALITGCASHHNETYRTTTTSMGGDTDAGYGIGVGATQQGAGAVQLTTTQLSADEARFLQRSAEYNQTSIQLGQTIVQKTDRPDLKSFGQRLVDDHTLANRQLQSIVAQTGASVPTAPNADQQQMLDRLNGLNGTDFDRAAIDDSMRLEQRQVNLYTQAANNAQNPSVRNYAQQNLTVNQDELNQLRGLTGPAPTAAVTTEIAPATPVPRPPSEQPPGPGVSPQQPAGTPAPPPSDQPTGPGVSPQQQP